MHRGRVTLLCGGLEGQRLVLQAGDRAWGEGRPVPAQVLTPAAAVPGMERTRSSLTWAGGGWVAGAVCQGDRNP